MLACTCSVTAWLMRQQTCSHSLLTMQHAVQAPSEAESQCAAMCKQGLVRSPRPPLWASPAPSACHALCQWPCSLHKDLHSFSRATLLYLLVFLTSSRLSAVRRRHHRLLVSCCLDVDYARIGVVNPLSKLCTSCPLTTAVMHAAALP